MGEPVDLVAPELRLTKITMVNDNEKVIEGVNSTVIVGFHGVVLHGEARDNNLLRRIVVEGDNKIWETEVFGGRDADGWQKWYIVLEDEGNPSTFFNVGEKVLNVTAEDSSRPPNVGPETVKQITLLIDTDPVVVDNIRIERQPGLQVGLLTRQELINMDKNKFQNIDFFQNEKFSIRASITHEFALAADGVTLNFLDGNNVELFSDALKPTGGSLYTPVWEIDKDMLISANPKYASGEHYLGVAITAIAEAGHIGGFYPEEVTNYLSSFCWWPESDNPRIEISKADENGIIDIVRGEMIPVITFDDDNLNTVHIAMIPVAEWRNLSGSTDEEKLISLDTADQSKNWNKWQAEESGIRNTVVPGDVNNVRGEFRMAVIVRDGKDDRAEATTRKVYTVNVIEDGIPVISITSHRENQIPNLRPSGINFTLTGTITNLDKVNVFRMAWISDTLNSDEQERIGREILRNPATTDPSVKFVKLWNNLTLTDEADREIGTNPVKIYKQQSFSKELDIFEDFKVDNVLESRKQMFFMMYTYVENQKTNENGEKEINETFQTIRLMPHTTPPVIEIVGDDPHHNDVFGMDVPSVSVGDDIHFLINAYSPIGVLIDPDGVRLSVTNSPVPLTPPNTPPTLKEYWEGMNKHLEMGTYLYTITATDRLGNESRLELNLRVESLPTLRLVTSPHNNGQKFSATNFRGADKIIINAEFTRAVETLNTENGMAIPEIQLEGFTNGKPRSAKFIDNRGEADDGHHISDLHSTIISFVYEVQPDDKTGPGGLTATKILLNPNNYVKPAHISAEGFYDVEVYPLDSVPTLPATKLLHVDGIAPRIKTPANNGITVTGTGGTTFQGKQWYRAGEELTIEVATDKEVMVLGTPQLRLSGLDSEEASIGGPFNPEHFAVFQKMKNDTTMVFSYKILDGDTAEPFDVNPYLSLSETDRNLITDKGNGLRGGNVLEVKSDDYYSGIYIDAVPPPTLNVLLTENSDTFGTFRITGEVESYRREDGGYDWATVEYTTDGVNYKTEGLNYTTTGGNREYIFTINAEGSGRNIYNVIARQTDRAGNVSVEPPPLPYEMGSTSDLVGIICENPNGAYPAGSILTFRLNFNGMVSYDGNSGASITIAGSGGSNQTGNTVLPILAKNDDFFLDVEWIVPEGIIMTPVTLKDINLSGVKRQDTSIFDMSNPILQGQIVSRVAAFNRPTLEVMSVRPTITVINGQSMTVTPLPANRFVLVPTGDKSVIELTFSHNVWPERGSIKVKPYGNWYIPPVLSNSDYSSILSALGGTNTLLERYYTETTHGLLKNNSGEYTGTPDTATKYVLRFDTGISGTTGAVADLREVFNTAGYMRQDIDVVSPEDVTGAGGAPLTSGALLENGTTTVEVHLNRLADGRQWLIEIDAYSFRDKAGNEFAGWPETIGSNTGSNGNNWFWSQKTAEPVIRVNRVSNNASSEDAHTNPSYNNPTPERPLVATLQRNVQYRIDCETPNSTITYGTTAENFRVSTVPNNTAHGNTYRPNASVNSPANSSLEDATAVELQSISPGDTYDSADNHTIGDQHFNTARKDYIAAKATHGVVTASDTGYEGAFKTVIVYRNGTGDGNTLTQQGSRRVKFEGTNLYGGATTISGFPLSNNDMSGRRSRFALQTGNDWIWVTWEIVANFWHVGLAVNSQDPNSGLDSGAWVFNNDHGTHSFRRYGNWGLRIGN